MPQMNIKINRLGDDPSFPEDKDREIVDLSAAPWKISFLEAGTQAGNHSIYITIPMGPDGPDIHLQTTWRLWQGATSAFKGAMERWAPAGTITTEFDPLLAVKVMQGYLRALLYFRTPSGISFEDILREHDHKLHFAISSAVGE